MEWKLFADLAEVAGDRRVEVAGGDTAGEALDALLDGRPALRERVLDGEGELLEHVTVLRNGETLGDLSASVEEGDELALMPPVSGG
jgi:molybdopterin synthase sulfur carrier subunit